MFQNSPTLSAVLLGSGALPNATSATLTLGIAIPPGSLLIAVIQGAQTSANALVTTVLGKGDEITFGGTGPFSYDASTAAYIRWVVFRTPSGYNSGQVIGFSTTSNWPATTYLSLIWLRGCTQYLGYGTTSRVSIANVIFQPSYALGSGTIINNAYRQNTLEILFNTNAAAIAWNGLGNSGLTPDAGSWTSFINGAGTALGVINLWAAFTNRRPESTALLGRYPNTLNNHETFIRFGGG